MPGYFRRFSSPRLISFRSISFGLSSFGLLLAAALLAASALVPAPCLAAAEETPEAALRQVQTAIDTSDAALLEKYMDVGRIAQRGVDAFMSDLVARPPKAVSGGGETLPLLAMLSSAVQSGAQSQTAQTMKMLVAEETRKFVVWGVASGNFSGKPVKKERKATDGGLFSPLFSDASVGRKELRSVKSVTRDGDKATASVTLFDHGSERSYPVDLALTRRQEGNWQVTDVTNAAALISAIRKEAESR